MIYCSKVPFQDKGCHAIVGFVIAVVFCILAIFLGAERPQTVGLVVGVMSGVVKEVFDYFDYGEFDVFDVFATAVGAFFGGLVIVIFQ